MIMICMYIPKYLVELQLCYKYLNVPSHYEWELSIIMINTIVTLYYKFKWSVLLAGFKKELHKL